MVTINGSTNSSLWTFKLVTTEGNYDIANNTSPLTVDVYIGRVSSSGSYMYGANISGSVACTGCTNLSFTYKNSDRVYITAGDWLPIATVKFNAVPHNPDGSKTVYVSASFTSNISPNSGSAAGNVVLTTIPRQATLTSAPDFTDEENPTIYFNNPAGSAVTVKACISLTGKHDDVIYRTVEPDSDHYTFDLNEIIPRDNKTGHDILRENTTGKHYRFVTFYITTWIGDNIYYSTLQRTYTVINCAPELNPTVENIDNDSYSLTNSRSKIIRYFNCPKLTFNATPKKGASIIEWTATCGLQTGVISDDHKYAQFNNVDSNIFTVSVTDNRGITVTETIKMDMIPYVNLTCNTSINTELDTDDTNSTADLTVFGDCYAGSFGKVNNRLDLEYRYKNNSTEYPTDGNGNDIWIPMKYEFKTNEERSYNCSFKSAQSGTISSIIESDLKFKYGDFYSISDTFDGNAVVFRIHYNDSLGIEHFATPTITFDEGLPVEIELATHIAFDENGNNITLKIPTTTEYEAITTIKNLDYTATYTIQVRAKDRIYTRGVAAKDEIVKILPVFDWSENDFNFNVPVTIQGKKIRTDGPNSTDRIARAYTQETDIEYEANSYIKLFRSDSPHDLYNQDIATFQENGLITINKDMFALVNIHILSYNNHQYNRSWIKLINYNSNDPSKSWRFTDCINYGLYTTSNITIMLKLSAGDIIGLQTAHPMTINTSGLVGSYIEIIEL